MEMRESGLPEKETDVSETVVSEDVVSEDVVSEDVVSEDVVSEKSSGNSDRRTTGKFIVRVAALVLGIVGVIMLICGIVLRNLDQESRKVPDKEQMPQAYIDEFFSDEGYIPDIRDYIEPED